MKTECSYCRQHYTLDDRYEGQLLDCPQCGHKFVAAPLEEGSQFIPPEERRSPTATFWCTCRAISTG